MDETSLFFQLEPNRTLATRALSGKKKSKNRLSIALTANMTCTMKLPPFVVYKHLRPRGFTRRSIRRPENLGVLWNSNSKAWMTIKLFESFLLDFEKRLKEAGRRKVLLLVDNFNGHKIVSIQDGIQIIRIKFLPPNVTAVYQPMDAGIYELLKLTTAEGILPDFNLSSAIPDLNKGICSDGVRELREALHQYKETSIESGIVPNMTVAEYIDFEATQEIDNPMSIEKLAEFHAFGDTTETMEEADPDECDDSQDLAVSVSDLFDACDIVQKFLEQSDRDTIRINNKLRSLIEEIRFLSSDRLVQSDITSYFNVE
ncbi:hypothetical protein R1sor_027509 [Riccia sorocarpa]|uniref:DDE-1 domain-containing protein n=1 Tax=Riccia sorocarpa TaxID=122646 RepID=A0ABD3GI27_9MARC